jgi:FixJ family two-component response regulator
LTHHTQVLWQRGKFSDILWKVSQPMNRPFRVSVIDDDECVRESLESLLKSMGYRVNTFAGAEEFLQLDDTGDTDCLILDVRLGGMSGPDLQRELIARSRSVPIVFITAHGDAMTRARVMSDGAVECLEKPFSEEVLLAAVHAGFGRIRDTPHAVLSDGRHFGDRETHE